MKTELALLVCVITFLIFKLWPWPGGNEMLMIVSMLLSGLYFYGSFYFFSDRIIRNQKLVISIVSGVGLSAVVVGFLFKLLSLSGANEMLIIGLPVVFVMLIIVIYLKTKNVESETDALNAEADKKPVLRQYYSNMIFRLTLWFVVGGAVFFISSDSITRFVYRNDPELAALQISWHNAASEEEEAKYEKLIQEHNEKLNPKN